MGLKVGTLVQPYGTVDIDSGYQVLGRTCVLDDITDQCIGIILTLTIRTSDVEDSDFSTGMVRWVQVCTNHQHYANQVQPRFLDDLWEIGQLY